MRVTRCYLLKTILIASKTAYTDFHNMSRRYSNYVRTNIIVIIKSYVKIYFNKQYMFCTFVMPTKTTGIFIMKNEFLETIANTAKSKNVYAKFEMSIQVNTLSGSNQIYETVRGSKAEVIKAIKTFTAISKEALFNDDVHKMWLTLQYDNDIIRRVVIDLYKQNY